MTNTRSFCHCWFDMVYRGTHVGRGRGYVVVFVVAVVVVVFVDFSR